MYENIIFADEDENHGDTQTVDEDLMIDRRTGEAQSFSFPSSVIVGSP
jgi:hypothetical protein